MILFYFFSPQGCQLNVGFLCLPNEELFFGWGSVLVSGLFN